MSLPSEEWRPVPGYEGRYEVSDQGRVRSLDRWIARRGGLAGYSFVRGQVLRPKVDSLGRHSVGLGRSKTVRVPTLVLLAFVGPKPPGYECCHGDGDPSHNWLGNLRWDTHSENMNDKVRHGRCVKRQRSQCPQRHPLVEPNLVAYHSARGHRSCLACARARAAQQKAYHRGEAFDFKAEADAKYRDIMGKASDALRLRAGPLVRGERSV